MSEERKFDFFSAIVLILSFIALVMLLIGPFGGVYLSGYSWNGYSCLFCFGYSTILDYIMQVLILILLILQILMAINNLLPKPFIPEDSPTGFLSTSIFGIISSSLIWGFAIIGLISFGVTYDYTYWWMDIGFYGPVVAGLINMILYILKYLNKI
jgi:hypothetical protein